MFVGCQFSLYPMTDRFVQVILGAVEGLHQQKDLRVETDDLSTLVIGAPQPLFAALEQCFLKAAASGEHIVLTATFSRGCPGEPDDPICQPTKPIGAIESAIDPSQVKLSGVKASAQFAVYPLGSTEYMEVIYREIRAIKDAGISSRAKHFCTRLDGDVSQIFMVLGAAFDRAATATGHVVITATISTASPTQL